MPTPRPNEPKDKFISRCIVEVTGEGKTNQQAIAQCISTWNQSKGLAMTGTEILISTDLIKLETVKGKNIGTAQLLPKGKFKHRVFGDMNFTDEKMDTAIKNFNAGIPQSEVAINFNHNVHGAIQTAAGWFAELFKDDKFLNAKFDFTDEAAQMIKDKKFKFVSAEVTEDFTDNKGKKHGFTIFGAGLTNTPFMTQQNPIMMFSADGGLSEFTEPTKKKILKVNNLEYPLTNEEYVMLEAIMKLLKIEKPEEIDGAIKKLQTPPDPKPEPSPDEGDKAKIIELETKNTKLETDLGVLTTNMKTVTEFTAELKKAQREKTLQALLDEFYVSPAILQVLKEKKILEVSDETFQMTIDAHRAGQPMYKDLQNTDGAGGNEKEDEKKPVNKFQKRVDELIADTAHPDIKEFNDAYDWIFANDSELAQEYENEQLKASGSTLKIV